MNKAFIALMCLGAIFVALTYFATKYRSEDKIKHR